MARPSFKRFVCAVCALAILACSIVPAAFAEGSEAANAQQLTTADVQQMQQTDDAVAALTSSDDFASMTLSEREAAVRETLTALAEQGLVQASTIYYDKASATVSFTYSCGVLGGVTLEDAKADDSELYAVPLGGGIASVDAETLSQENGLLESAGTRYEFASNAMIYYAFDDLINSTRYPYYAYMQAFWTTLGVSTKLDTSVTVSDLQHMDDYDLCILSAHGSYYTYATGYFTRKYKTTPVIILLEESTMLKDMLYSFELLSQRIIKVNGYYCLTPEFFSNTYSDGRLSDTIIISETCEFYGVNNSEDTSMADAMLAGGAKAVIGYINNVYAVYSRSILWDTVNCLILGMPVQEALDHAKGVYGENDLIWYNSRGGERPHSRAAYAVLHGDANATIYTGAALDAAA